MAQQIKERLPRIFYRERYGYDAAPAVPHHTGMHVKSIWSYKYSSNDFGRGL